MKQNKYKTQNDKVWTINFSKMRFVEKSRILIPALKNHVGLRSMGLTIMLAIEYCLQEHILKDFSSYVNSKRRNLLEN